jgi:hypothetical protein
MVVQMCCPSYAGGISRRMVVQVGSSKNKRPYLKNKQRKIEKGWGLEVWQSACQQGRGSEFDLQYLPKSERSLVQKTTHCSQAWWSHL